MDASRRPPHRRRHVFRPKSLRLLCLMLLAAAALALSTVALLPGGYSSTDTVYGASLTHFEATTAVSPTSTQQAVPPTLSLAVPSSAQGPVGAHVTITGSNWGTADVAVGAASPGASCADQNSWAQSFSTVRPRSDQTIVFSFDWPQGLNVTSGAYSICAANAAGTANVTYQVLSTSPPSLAVDPLTPHAGDLVKVTGANFVGSGQITLTVTDGQGKTRELTTLSPDATGGFTLQFQPRPTDVGDEVMHAFSTGTPQGMRPALKADAKLHVQVALTPTVVVTPTTAVSGAPPPPQNGGGSSKLLLVVLIVVFLLALLVVGGVVAYVVMRRRNRPGDGSPYQSGQYGGYGGYGGFGGSGAGYGMPGNVYSNMGPTTGYGPGASAMGGMDDPDWDSPTQGYYGAGAAGWPESDEPDPSWRPRPMTGQWRAQDDQPDGAYGGYGAGGSGQYPSPDPWGNGGGSPERLGRPSGSGQSSGGGSRGGYNGYPPAGPGGYPTESGRAPNDRGGSGRRGLNGGQRGDTRDDTTGRYPNQPPDGDW